MDPHARRWFTGFFKVPVDGPVEFRENGLAGDGQADLRFHGGPDKAVLAYSADHYPLWRGELNRPEMTGGGFGENLTIAGLSENSVCIGDRWRSGTVLFQVSQPRQPCWKLGRRWNLPDLPKRVIQTNRSGWYLRVLESGVLTAPTPLHLADRPHPQWTIARANRVLYDRRVDPAERLALATIPELSAAWRTELLP